MYVQFRCIFFSVKVLGNYLKHTGRPTSHRCVQKCVQDVTYSQQDIYFDLGIVRPSALLLLIAARVAARQRPAAVVRHV